jgi:hypothetical protein
VPVSSFRSTTKPGRSTSRSPGRAAASSVRSLPEGTRSVMPPCCARTVTWCVIGPAGDRSTLPRSASTSTAAAKPSRLTSSPLLFTRTAPASARPSTPPWLTVTSASFPIRSSLTPAKLASANSAPSTSSASTPPCSARRRASPSTWRTVMPS